MDTLTRELPARIVADGRTLETRIVPYNVEATVADPPDYRPYRELFTPGAFRKQVASAAHRAKLLLNFEHEQGIRGYIGHATELDDRDDGLYGSFRLSRREDGEKALELVEEGLLTGLSVEFTAHRTRNVGGVEHRQHATLQNVALCRYPAYPGAEVLAVRERPAVIWEPEPPMDPALVARLEALGVTVG